MQFLELIEKDPERLADLTHAEYAAYGGFEGSEVIMWLVMRGALSQPYPGGAASSQPPPARSTPKGRTNPRLRLHDALCMGP
jgi:hypothetical protein